MAAWRGVDKGRNPQSACIWLSVSSTAEFDGNAPCTRVRRHANPWVCPRPPSCLSRSRVRGMARCREDRPRNDVSLSPSPRCSRPGSQDGPRQPPFCGACAACVEVVSHDGMAKLPWPSIRPANKVLEPPGACGKNQKGDSRGSIPSVQRLSTEPSLEREALGKTPKPAQDDSQNIRLVPPNIGRGRPFAHLGQAIQSIKYASGMGVAWVGACAFPKQASQRARWRSAWPIRR